VRITLLGHASVLVELDGATCLMDPVFRDPFEEGTVVSCPRRAIDVDALPRVDILIVSHRHPDHFDVASLDQVARDVEAICPPDPLIVYALRELGFENVTPVAPMAPILGPDFELFPTRSELTSIPEMGMVFRDGSGTFWNQVDTPLADETIATVRHLFGTIDVLFAMYASQNFEFFESRATEFPYETHRRNLETALAIDPKVVVPASAGFRFCGEHQWLNPFLFPISRERFVVDLARLAPGVDARTMDPGDVLEIDGDKVVQHTHASNVARVVDDDTAHLAFDPTAPVPPLIDTNPDGYAHDRLAQLAVDVINELGAWFASAAACDDRVVRAYREDGVRYRIGLVFPDGSERRLDLDCAAQPPRLSELSSPASEPDLVHRIAASALAGWAEHRRSFFSVRASSRRYGTAYRLRRDDATVALERRDLPDLLMYYLTYIAAGSEVSARSEVNQQIAALPTRRQPSTVPSAPTEGGHDA
jgi:UDP-MurNAc hydroxylase